MDVARKFYCKKKATLEVFSVADFSLQNESPFKTSFSVFKSTHFALNDQHISYKTSYRTTTVHTFLNLQCTTKSLKEKK